MITLPEQFVETKFPGYFWNTNDHKLYSLKVDGVLKPLTVQKCYMDFSYGKPQLAYKDNYSISVRGLNKRLFVEDLEKLKLPTKHEIPMKEGTK